MDVPEGSVRKVISIESFLLLESLNPLPKSVPESLSEELPVSSISSKVTIAPLEPGAVLMVTCPMLFEESVMFSPSSGCGVGDSDPGPEPYPYQSLRPESEMRSLSVLVVSSTSLTVVVGVPPLPVVVLVIVSL